MDVLMDGGPTAADDHDWDDRAEDDLDLGGLAEDGPVVVGYRRGWVYPVAVGCHQDSVYPAEGDYRQDWVCLAVGDCFRHLALHYCWAPGAFADSAKQLDMPSISRRE
jgi:hypothetical protein